MEQTSLKKNYIFNTTLTALNFLFPLITFPYISRVLGPEGIGKINFAQSFVSYFMLLATLGIPLYGIREVAKVRNNKEEMSKIVWELFFINLILTFISLTVLIVLVFVLDKTRSEALLIIITGSSMFFSTFLMEWFYRGIEKYQYITIRSTVFKILSLILMFLAVTKKGDYITYALISVIATTGSCFLNLWNSRKYLVINWKNLNLLRHLKPIIMIFWIDAAVTSYVNLNNLMLGYLSGDKAVGIYSTAFKVINLIMTLITSLTPVLIPRLSFHIHNGNQQEYHKILKKSFDFTIFFSFPAMVGIFLTAKYIISLWGGSDYSDSVIVLQFLVVYILLSGISNITGSQILFPNNRQKFILISVFCALFVNIILNFLLIPRFSFLGATFSIIGVEIVIFTLQIYFCKNLNIPRLFDKRNMIYLFASAVMGIVVFVFNNVILNRIINIFHLFFIRQTAVDLLVLFCSVIIGCISYAVILILAKDAFLLEIIGNIKNKLPFFKRKSL